MKTAFVCICSSEYIKYYNVLYDSLLKYAPESDRLLFYIGKDIPYRKYQFDINHWYDNCVYADKLTRICSLRARAVLAAFDLGYNAVVFLGAKVEFFSSPHVMLKDLETHNAVVTPHILEPLPEDGKFPSNASVSWTGHISTDIVGFKNTLETKKFLMWQDEIMKTKCATTSYTYLDQSWLNFLPFFVPNVKILRDPGYNVAYWCFKQRLMDKNFTGTWLVEDKEQSVGRPLVCFQYSGLPLDNPKRISTHQDRYEADGDFLEFLEHYVERVK